MVNDFQALKTATRMWSSQKSGEQNSEEFNSSIDMLYKLGLGHTFGVQLHPDHYIYKIS